MKRIIPDVLLGFEVGTGEPVRGFVTKEAEGYKAVPTAKKRIVKA